MLPFDSTSDPLFSSISLSLRTEDSPPEESNLHVADPEELCHRQEPSFCIRDYVLSSRSKGIKNSWPFRRKSLQICLRHGLVNLLPPFERPDLVRAQSLSKAVEQNEPLLCLETASHPSTKVSSFITNGSGPSGEKPSVLGSQLGLPSKEAQNIFLNSLSPQEGSSANHGSVPLNASEIKEPTQGVTPDLVKGRNALHSQNLTESSKPLKKKCKLIVKLHSLADHSRQTEHTVSNCTSSADPMATKTCPICKVFSSTSNTTLNAHIDQCLSGEAIVVKQADVLSKSAAKLKKKKLIDIYATALRCTLEDLDQRNGTKWASSEMALFAAPEKSLLTNENSVSLPPTQPESDDKDVYVNSHGVKVRILSKPRDGLLRKGLNVQRVCKNLSDKKLCFKNRSKNEKDTKVHGKKNRKVGILKTETSSRRRVTSKNFSQREDTAAVLNVSKVGDHVSGTGRQHICSESSEFDRAISRKDVVKAQKNWRLVSGSSKVMAISNSCVVNRMDSGSSSPSKRFGSFSGWSTKAHSSDNLLQKISGSSGADMKQRGAGTFVGHGTCKIRKTGPSTCMEIDSEGHKPGARCKHSSRLRELNGRSTLFAEGSDKVSSCSKPNPFGMLRKHRSPVKTGKNKRTYSGSAKSGIEADQQTRKRLRTHDSVVRQVVSTSVQENGANENSPCEKNISGADATEVRFGDDSEQFYNSKMHMIVESDSCVPPSQVAAVHLEGLVSDSSADLSDERQRHSNQNSKCATLVFDATVGRKIQLAVSEEQSKRIQMSDLEGVGGKNILSVVTNKQCEANVSLVEEHNMFNSAACETVLDVQEDSSITSSSESGTQVTVPIESAKSRTPTHDSEFKRLECNQMDVDTVLKEKLLSPTPPPTTIMGNDGSHSAPSNDLHSVDKPFCCSCRERLSQESQQQRRSVISMSTVTSSKGKMVPHFQVGPRASSSFISYQSGRNHTISTGIEFLPQSLSTKISSESPLIIPGNPSNPTLRLMGKNLFVNCNEELTRPRVPTMEYVVHGHCMPVGFENSNYVLKQEGVYLHHLNGPSCTPIPSVANRQFLLPGKPTNRIAPVSFCDNFMVQTHRHSEQSQIGNLIQPAHPAHMMREMYMIDDSPIAAEPRNDPNLGFFLPTGVAPTTTSNPPIVAPPFCFPAQNQSQFFTGDNTTGGSRPPFPSRNPAISHGHTYETPSSFFPNPYLYQTPQPGCTTSSIYYPQILR